MIDEKTLMYMEEYGGSFVRELAYLYRLADTENKRRLEECFHDIFERYKNFGKEEDKKQLEEIPKIPPVWYIYRCDKCGCEFSLPIIFTPKFCPRCGEKLEVSK